MLQMGSEQLRFLLVQKRATCIHVSSNPLLSNSVSSFSLIVVTKYISIHYCIFKNTQFQSHFSHKIKSNTMNLNTSSEVETRTMLDNLCNFDRKGLFDLGHPLVNRIAESFVKAAGIGAVQAVSRDAYFSAIDATGTGNNGVKASSDGSVSGKRRLSGLRGETSNKSLEDMVINAGKESLQWGVAAGIFSGLTYGLKEARGAHDWKNSAVAGAITGATLALTMEDSTHEHVAQCAITGAAISTAANLLTGIF